MSACLNGFLDLARTDAAGAHVFVGHGSLLDNTHLLDIRFPYSLGLSVGVAHIVAELNSFPADITLSHCLLRIPKIL